MTLALSSEKDNLGGLKKTFEEVGEM